jgi:hypothetical protein
MANKKRLKKINWKISIGKGNFAWKTERESVKNINANDLLTYLTIINYN